MTTARCPTHHQRAPCTACAGDHAAGEHRDGPPHPACRRCQDEPTFSTRIPHTTYTDRSTTDD